MARRAPNYIWKKVATREWLAGEEERLSLLTGGRHAVVERPQRMRLSVEYFCATHAEANKLKDSFSGTITKLPLNWATRCFAAHETKPLAIGNRLTIIRASRSARKKDTLVIPAEAAFGTGNHATTAMSLRLLERVSRRVPPGWRMLDAGTGSGILALAGARFGACAVVAVENDPMALRTARRNAATNRIRGVRFILGDVKKHAAGCFDVITANLYSELLAEMLPKFARSLAPEGRMILSGVMRSQERAVMKALKTYGFAVREIKRRGKWIALLASRSPSCSPSYS